MAEEEGNLESFLEEDDESDAEEERRQRLVIFGKIDLTVKAGLAHHWGVKLVDCPQDPPFKLEDYLIANEDESPAGEIPAHIAECLNAEGDWFEVDGFQMDDVKHLKNNSINGSDDYTTPGEHRGVKSRLMSAPEQVVGVTQRTDQEIFIFNKEYLAKNPKYSLLRNNCQNYADEFCDFLCRSTGVLGSCGIVLENVKDAMAKAYDSMPPEIRDAVDAMENAAADEDSALHDVVQKSKSGFNKLRSFKRDFKAKWKNKFGDGGTAV